MVTETKTFGWEVIIIIKLVLTEHRRPIVQEKLGLAFSVTINKKQSWLQN